jgi:hypothetical protein
MYAGFRFTSAHSFRLLSKFPDRRARPLVALEPRPRLSFTDKVAKLPEQLERRRPPALECLYPP